MRPERLFLVIAGVTGLILTFLVPPMGGGNEEFNVQRVASIAYGGLLIGPTEVPRGIAEFIEQGGAFFVEGATPPFGFGRDDFAASASVRLQPEARATLQPNAISVLNPVAYLPQALAIRVAADAGARPLVLLYLGRLTGLACALALTLWAIRVIPSHKDALCALALLPPLVYSRSVLDADQLTNGLAFLFGALVLRECVATQPIERRVLLALAGLGFAIAQCKSAYLLLPLLVWAIPASRFEGRSRAAWALVAWLPGFLASLLWMLHLKTGYFAGLSYSTWAGEVNPDRQLAFVLQHPLAYLQVLLRTVFSVSFVGATLRQLLNEFGPPVSSPMLVAGAAAFFLLLALRSDPTAGSASYPSTLRRMGAALCVLTPVLILTLLYLQWNGLHAATVQGFQGRYLYPLLPLLALVLPGRVIPELAARRLQWLVAYAALGLGGMVVTLARTYY